MHRSKLSTFVIDCNTQDLDEAAAFWSGALGRPIHHVTGGDPGNEKYRGLEGPDSEILLLLQKVDHESRVHLDIESDDIDAEVQRLEKLGAKRIDKVRTWVVMEAPTGHRFCVVRPQRGPLGDENSNRWDG